MQTFLLAFFLPRAERIVVFFEVATLGAVCERQGGARGRHLGAENPAGREKWLECNAIFASCLLVPSPCWVLWSVVHVIRNLVSEFKRYAALCTFIHCTQSHCGAPSQTR